MAQFKQTLMPMLARRFLIAVFIFSFSAFSDEKTVEICRVQLSDGGALVSGEAVFENESMTWEADLLLCSNGQKRCYLFQGKPNDYSELEIERHNQILTNRFRLWGGVRRRDLDGGLMNCHAYACAYTSVPGVHEATLITDKTEDTPDQFEWLLKTFFELQAMDFMNLFTLARKMPETVQNGDVVVFYDKAWRPIHSAVVVGQSGEPAASRMAFLKLQSKFGEAGIYDTPLWLMNRVYSIYAYSIHRRNGVEALEELPK
ncbi:MAG: hypothetical protein AAF202_08235 [Pseudomonadota bacterium]